MLRFPFSRPVPQTNMHEEKKRDDISERVNMQTEKADIDGLSPELSLLLSMALKDGMQHNSMFKMFEDMLPFISGSERKTIQKLLAAKNPEKSANRSLNDNSGSSLSAISKQSRQQDLINVLERYSGQDNETMQQLKRSMQMQKDFEEMASKFENLGNMQNAKPEEMIEMMSMFMPDEDMSELRNMSSMMKLFSNMGNLKPEDMMKFMSLNKK